MSKLTDIPILERLVASADAVSGKADDDLVFVFDRSVGRVKTITIAGLLESVGGGAEMPPGLQPIVALFISLSSGSSAELYPAGMKNGQPYWSADGGPDDINGARASYFYAYFNGTYWVFATTFYDGSLEQIAIGTGSDPRSASWTLSVGPLADGDFTQFTGFTDLD